MRKLKVVLSRVGVMILMPLAAWSDDPNPRKPTAPDPNDPAAGTPTEGTPFGIEGPSHDMIDPLLAESPDELPLIKVILDPIEGFNRVSYFASDKVLYWVVRPVGKGYRVLAPYRVRRAIDNFGENLAFPVRFVNNALQGKGKATAEETGRFVVNSTVGLAGLFDPASRFGMRAHREDFGQTFGRWGMGPGFYLVIPMMGPSSGRDGVGRVGDTLLNPATYIPFLGGFLFFNRSTFRINDYEIFRQSESDPYVLMREIWGIDREKDVRDYAIPAKDWEHEPAPTLEAVLFRVQDPTKFGSRGPEGKAEIETTGKELPYSHWMQESPAPAVFIIPGIGSHRNAEMVRALAEVMYNAGYSVIAISSVFNWEFMDRGATASLPGYTPADSLDVYNALDAVNRDLESRYPGRMTSKSLMGLSLGALHTLFIADAEGDRPMDSVRFDHYAAINPPADPIYALSQLDACYNAPKQWSEEDRARKIEQTLMKAALVFAQPIDSVAQGGYGLPFDTIESQFIMGISYRYGLRNAIYESQRRQNMGVLKRDFNWFRRDPLYDEISTYSFSDYLRAFLMAHYLSGGESKGRTSLNFVQSAGLRALKGTLATDERVKVFTNWNDFVLNKNDVEWMQSTLKDRITVFPEGGHLGNLHLPEVQKALVESLK